MGLWAPSTRIASMPAKTSGKIAFVPRTCVHSAASNCQPPVPTRDGSRPAAARAALLQLIRADEPDRDAKVRVRDAGASLADENPSGGSAGIPPRLRGADALPSAVPENFRSLRTHPARPSLPDSGPGPRLLSRAMSVRPGPRTSAHDPCPTGRHDRKVGLDGTGGVVRAAESCFEDDQGQAASPLQKCTAPLPSAARNRSAPRRAHAIHDRIGGGQPTFFRDHPSPARGCARARRPDAENCIQPRGQTVRHAPTASRNPEVEPLPLVPDHMHDLLSGHALKAHEPLQGLMHARQAKLHGK